MMNDFTRRLLFRNGFGDGAKCSAIKHSDKPDYMEGWEAGRKAAGIACKEHQERHNLEPPSILRAQRDMWTDLMARAEEENAEIQFHGDETKVLKLQNGTYLSLSQTTYPMLKGDNNERT